MLDGEAVVEAELVRERELAPQQLIALAGGQRGLLPDVREIAEFHGRRFLLSPCSGYWGTAPSAAATFAHFTCSDFM